MYFKIIFLVSTFPIIFSFFSQKSRFQKVKLNMFDKEKQHYIYAKEYYDFYQKYKDNQGFRSSIFVNYKEFAERHQTNYLIFEKNYDLIKDANNMMQTQNNKFSIDINKYADTVDLNDELSGNLNMKLQTSDNIVNKLNFSPFMKFLKNPFSFLKKKEIPINWNETSYMSSVKNQGQCGSCWAFSTTNVLETHMRIHNYSVERLSEQQLIDCSNKNYGCEGGFMHTAFEYIIDNQGLLENKYYGYEGVTNNCSSVKDIITPVRGSDIKDYDFVIPSSVIDMKNSLSNGPISIAVDANNIFFRFYRSGVIDIPNNYSRALNHAVVLTGYDYDEDGMYWIIQNSWGKDWGDNGFCRIRATQGEGILLCQKYGVYPINL